MKKITLLFYLLIYVLLLAGCQSTALISSDDRYFKVTPSATIEITQSLSVAPNSARAFLQNGKVISMGQLDLYDIDCEIEINTVSESRQIIEPGIFNVLATAQEESPIVMSMPVMLAALNYAWASDSPVDIKRYYHFSLSAQNEQSNSQVRALICRGAQDEPYNAQLPTFEQMRQAVGQYVIFNL